MVRKPWPWLMPWSRNGSWNMPLPSLYIVIRERSFAAALNQEVCDLLCIAKTYSAVYCPQANSMVEWCNYMLLVMLRACLSNRMIGTTTSVPCSMHIPQHLTQHGRKPLLHAVWGWNDHAIGLGHRWHWSGTARGSLSHGIPGIAARIDQRCSCHSQDQS